MKFELQASIVLIGLFALVLCTFATTNNAKLTDYVDSKWLQNNNSDQKYLIAELIEARKSDEVFASGQFIIKLHDELQSIHDGNYPAPPTHDEDRQWSSLGPYEQKFSSLMAQLAPEVVARFERLVGEINRDWLDQLRDYLLALKSIVQFDDYGCLERNYKPYAQTVNLIYGHELDAFLAGESKLYPRFQAFLLHYGKRALVGCVDNGFVFGDQLEPEKTLDDILSRYGKFNAAQSQFKLYNLAKEFDFVNGKFDSKKMLASCPRTSLHDDELGVRDRNGATFDRFYALVQPMCALYRRDVINNSLVGSLARLLIPEIDLQSGLRWSERALKLKEYERIYSRFCSAKKEDLAANFEQNKSQSRCKKLLCGLA